MCSGHGRSTHAKAVTNHQMKELVRSGRSAYDILGVSRDTTPTDVEKAYRRKCLKWHPDKWQTHSPEEQKKVETPSRRLVFTGTYSAGPSGHLRRHGPEPQRLQLRRGTLVSFRGTPFSHKDKGAPSAGRSPTEAALVPIRTGAILVAMAVVEVEAPGWQKRGGIEGGRALGQHRNAKPSYKAPPPSYG